MFINYFWVKKKTDNALTSHNIVTIQCSAELHYFVQFKIKYIIQLTDNVQYWNVVTDVLH